MKNEIILALDIGSSSIRCSAYKIVSNDGGKAGTKVEPMSDDSFAVRQMRTVEPNTGKIMLQTEGGTNLLDEIDGIIDECLEKLRNSADEIRVVGLAFATFCMNLIAIDENGKPVGKEATLSYACSTPAVGEECRWLKR